MKNESVKKSLEKSKNVLEEKRKIARRKICLKKDTHVYNNCYELRSRAIKHGSINISKNGKDQNPMHQYLAAVIIIFQLFNHNITYSI